MKVKIKKPVPGMAYFGGETPDLDPKTCAPWIESGHMVIVPETEGDENKLPEDLPYREVFFKEGLTMLEDVVKIKDTLEEIKGIGKASAEKVRAYLDGLNEQ